MSLAAITTPFSELPGAADIAPSSHAADLASTSAFADASMLAVPSMPGPPEVGVTIRGESLTEATRTIPSNVNPLSSMMCPSFPVPSDPTPPSSNSDSSAMLPPPLPLTLPQALDRPLSPAASSNTQSVAPDRLMASLRELPELYSLSSADLHALVGQVIREEGFLQLLESLDRMWREKGFLSQL
ncbi:hypothetical protein GLOTRDRAFT_127561 [Gloeophyllum trabeum ATCC 11539]|uniref:Uncharacterized protein n=1 Tax=Gloeophyllum trabeum (strain ATCC 11539 / FP-39264 / Madison 617) TaxID=670483 RepID=S7QB77_GLOTA|nr:uncharacterized protein GLOTRDRAFT_127561 [Gloeophyllum trabeum ATCC 11539]EPQ57191.1 hypothetical protein GLOTRDRAFT_127561 [Gloeophyllum trabeum ATCC 11539]